MTRKYELMIIIDPDEPEKKVLETVEKLLTDAQLQIAKQDIWGLRTLAYPIKKKNRGRYAILNLQTDLSPKITELNSELLMQDGIMRHVIRKAHASPLGKLGATQGSIRAAALSADSH